MKARLRQEKHLLGKDFMLDLDYLKAMNAFLEALEKHGPHVNLLADLTECFYKLGRTEDYLLTAKRLEFELAQALPSLQKNHAIKTYNFLAKIYEETGYVSKALNLYQQSSQIAVDLTGDLQTQTYISQLRLKSFLQIKENLLEEYQLCLKLKTHSLALKTELSQALISAEIVLFGTQKASARALQFIKDNSTVAFDAKAILLNLIEESIKEKMKIPELTNAIKQVRFKNLNNFEQSILNFYKMPTLILSTAELTFLQKELSLINYVRVAVLNIRRIKNRYQNFEAQRNLFKLIDKLDNDSRLLLIRNCDLGSQQLIKEIVFNSFNGTLATQGRKLAIKKGSTALQCFEVFSSTRTLSIEQVNSKIFKFAKNKDLYDRIRMEVWRLNKDLHAITNLEKTFVLSAQDVQLNSSYIITRD